MKELDQILAAASKAVGNEYFWLPRFGADPVYRERVYCYELYHQLRLRWPLQTNFFLSGEIDKSGHHALQQLGVKQEKPDLLIHIPGGMDNHAIIEVKHAEAQDNGIEKDLRTLQLFTHKVKYARALYLIYGEDADAFLERIYAKVIDLEVNGPIELWLHTEVGTEARLMDVIE